MLIYIISLRKCGSAKPRKDFLLSLFKVARIEITFDRALGRFFKLFAMDAYAGELFVAVDHRVQLFAVLLHFFFLLFFAQIVALHLFFIRIDESKESISFLNDNTFCYIRQDIQFLFYLFRIYILPA